MSRVQVMLSLDLPDPQEEAPETVSVEDKIRHALDLIDSGYKSDTEWIMVNKFYRDLMAREKKSPRVQNLIDMIEPVLAKFGYHKVSSEG